jgi:hypothetical protein
LDDGIGHMIDTDTDFDNTAWTWTLVLMVGWTWLDSSLEHHGRNITWKEHHMEGTSRQWLEQHQ